MQSSDKDQSKPTNDIDKNIQPGSTISDPEEKELRKYDDWKSHKHEKHPKVDDDFRAGELHGVVGKEIHDVMQKDHLKTQQEVTEQAHTQKHGQKTTSTSTGTSQQSKSGESQTQTSQSKSEPSKKI